jgi:mono/diheme cytochrome c family protein
MAIAVYGCNVDMYSSMWRIGLGLLMVALACGVTTAQPAPSAQIQHGKYLVEHVAMCVQCHTPRDTNGALDRTRLLQGAPIPVPAPFPTSQWAFEAPKIASLPGWTVEDAMRLLQTGMSATGYAPRPPMPPFRMTQEDAAAVVAYLKSLP